MPYTLLIDNKQFKSKPGDAIVPAISKRIANYRKTVTQEEVAEMVGKHGQTMVLATMNGTRAKSNMEQQQLVALDFDNSEIVNGQKSKTTGSKYSSVASIYQDPWIKANASFIYSTFSHSDDWHRFRVVFFLDKPLTNNAQVEMLYKWLMAKYPNADNANKDSSRLFFGGTEYVEVKFGNELKTSQVMFDKKEATPQKTQTEAKYKKAEPITHDKALEAFENYLEKDKENLQEYENALSAIWVLARAALTGEISYPDAYLFAEKLAMGNDEWAENNNIKLKEALRTPLNEFHTSYSFSEKFIGVISSVAGANPNDMIATSKYLVDMLKIKLFNNRLYFRYGNHWISDNNQLLRAVDQYIELRGAQQKELFTQFQIRAELVEDDFFPIQFRNDYYLSNGQIISGRSEAFTPYYMDVEYRRHTYSEKVDSFIDFLTCDREDIRRVIEDMLGHILMTKGFPHKVFFFIGEKGANGKSTFLEMLNNWIGDLGTNISLENFNDSTSVVELEGKLVNIGDDIDAGFLDKSSNFKILASGNTLMVRPIYATPYRMKNKATLIFTANDMPVFKDKSGGIARRLVIIPCDNVVTEADFTIDEKLSTDTAKSYLLNLAILGLERIKSNGGKISKSENIEVHVEGYLTESNSVLQFIEDEGIDETITSQGVYIDYANYCDDLGFKKYSKTSFTQTLKRNGYDHVRKMKMGKRLFYYEKIGR